MTEKTTDGDLEALRKYIAEEAERLGQIGAGIVHRIDLDEVDEQAPSVVPKVRLDPLERDVDLLFGSSEKPRRSS